MKRTDYKGWAYGLKQCGYATSPTYAQKLIGIIELYKLYNYDTANKFDKFMVERSAVSTKVPQQGSLHQIQIYNKNYYLVVRKGDTFKSLAKKRVFLIENWQNIMNVIKKIYSMSAKLSI